MGVVDRAREAMRDAMRAMDEASSAGSRRRARARDDDDARETGATRASDGGMKDDVAVDLATSARAMREACARGDARALRRAFQSHCAHFYDAHGRTMRADEKTAALRDVDDDGYALIDRAALADDLGAYEWLAERGAGGAFAVAGRRDDDADGSRARRRDDEEDAFREKLTRENAAETYDASGKAEGADWETYAAAEREWSSTGVLGDETHRASVWAAAARARRGETTVSVSRVDEEARKRKREALEREAAAQRRKLDALRAEDAAWRAALERDESARKKPSAARTLVEYRSKWDTLLRAAAEEKTNELRAKDFPFVCESKMTPATAFRDFLTTDAPHDERRVKLREELLRWHPDKFSRYFSLCREDELEDVKARVNATSQAVREAFKAFASPPPRSPYRSHSDVY